jgi:single-strand DNA-binding protein
MARSLNKAQVIGRLGRDPETKNFSNGGSVVTFPVATSEQWKDRNTGERRERTEWHLIAIYNEALGRLAISYLKKGDQVFLEGKMEARKWRDQSGQDRYTTEIALRPYAGEMTFLGSNQARSAPGGAQGEGDRPRPDHDQPRGGGTPSSTDRDRTAPERESPPADLYSGSRGIGPGYGRSFDDDVPF